MYHLQRRDCPCRWRIFSRHDLAFGSGAEEDRAGFAPAGAADAGVALFRACPIAGAALAHTDTWPTGPPVMSTAALGPPGRDDHNRGAHARSLSDLQAPEA